MRTPAFWNSPSLLSTLLLPLSVIYEMGATLRRAWTKPVMLPVPVICIGGLTAGGAGKTPVALHVGRKLKEKHIAAFFLSRGYGGTEMGPLLVDPEEHTAAQVGDEPLLLARVLPTVIAKDRVNGAKFAIAQGAKVIVMDDGFQNPAIAKTLSLLVIDGERGFGNGRLLPSGPLREPWPQGCRRAHAIIVINNTNLLPALPQDRPVLFARTQAAPETAAVRGKKIIAFCGLAYPQKFFDMLRGQGAELAESIPFSDHYPYTEADIKMLARKAKAIHTPLVTTPKDAVRLPPAFRQWVTVVDITLSFENDAALDALIDYALTHEAV
ncbi:MAG: tetraacyldisaccharide 4'-kinase [Pseudomonadota bacterium]|nr:tetraacyldisaccharide 4'-kinase [Pseudomonadota bacterium]